MLFRSQGHTGEIYCVSRRGILPETHVEKETSHDLRLPELPLKARLAMKFFRQYSTTFDWQDVVSSLRTEAQEWWWQLSSTEKSRFNRHIQRYWDSLRHRMSSQVASELHSQKKLDFYAGKVVTLNQVGNCVRVSISLRNGEKTELDVSYLFNCTGPDYGYSDSLLVKRLLRRGILDRHETGYGFHANRDGAILDGDNNKSGVLYTLGPPLKGVLGETTAVPEIRMQAFKLASLIVKELEGNLIRSHSSELFL